MTTTRADRFAVRFNQKTSDLYHNNKRRARMDGKELAFTLPELRDFIALHALDQPCPFCGVTLDIDNLSLDHILPVSRGGNYFLTNMRGCCKRCNQIKGIMDEPEFAELLRLIQKWPARVANNLLSRLYAGGKKVRG